VIDGAQGAVDRNVRNVPDRRMYPSDALAIIQYLDELRD